MAPFIKTLDHDELNVIGDIHGDFAALQALIEIMPKAPILSVGDLVDRGANSKDVIQYFMDSPNASAIVGNHELMMLTALRDDPWDHYLPIWAENGGKETLKSYGLEYSRRLVAKDYCSDALTAALDFIGNLPVAVRFKDFVISHAPLDNKVWQSAIKAEEDLKNVSFKSPEAMKALQKEWRRTAESFVWNKSDPDQIDGLVGIYGHCWFQKSFVDIKGDLYARCIDGLAEGLLVGLNLPSGKIFSVPRPKQPKKRRKF